MSTLGVDIDYRQYAFSAVFIDAAGLRMFYVISSDIPLGYQPAMIRADMRGDYHACLVSYTLARVRRLDGRCLRLRGNDPRITFDSTRARVYIGISNRPRDGEN